MSTTVIPKEEIVNYHFTAAPEDRSEFWVKELQYAVRLGNEFKGKTVISFQTLEGVKTVETTIWSLTNDYIQLKGGIHVPLKSLIDIHF